MSVRSAVRVSTVITAYNAERTLSQAVDSALEQKCDGHEVIVVNDGSSDGTAAILARYHRRIRVIEQDNQGAAGARNLGVRQARGRYIAFLDADDLWLPGKLEAMLRELEQAPTASLAFSEYSSFSDDGGEFGCSALRYAPSLREMMERSLPPILTSTWVLPKETFERSGGFSDAFKGGQGFEDSWLLIMLREIGHFIYVPEAYTRYRIDPSRENADRYGRALATFITLARKRYGRQGRALVRNAKNLQCRFLLSKAAHQLDSRERLDALRTLYRIAKVRPCFLLGAQVRKRLTLRQNLDRLSQLTRFGSGKKMSAE
jgi:glycosyltransferase involved in cell wall biosynthesis